MRNMDQVVPSAEVGVGTVADELDVLLRIGAPVGASGLAIVAADKASAPAIPPDPGFLLPPNVLPALGRPSGFDPETRRVGECGDKLAGRGGELVLAIVGEVSGVSRSAETGGLPMAADSD